MDSDLKNIDDDKEIKVAIIIFCIDIFDLLFNVHGNIRPTSQINEVFKLQSGHIP